MICKYTILIMLVLMGIACGLFGSALFYVAYTMPIYHMASIVGAIGLYIYSGFFLIITLFLVWLTITTATAKERKGFRHF